MSSELMIVKREMERAAVNGLQSWPLWEFTSYEKVLGFSAFTHWLEKGLTLKKNGFENSYFEVPQETARIAAVEFIVNQAARPSVANFLVQKIPSFNPVQEAEMALTQPRFGKEWESSLTRSTIILCSEMSFLFTGMQGERLNVPEELDFSQAGRDWLEEVFGTLCAEELFYKGKKRQAPIYKI
jgi:hypothetical protein